MNCLKCEFKMDESPIIEESEAIGMLYTCPICGLTESKLDDEDDEMIDYEIDFNE